jgi:acylphosphatase
VENGTAPERKRMKRVRLIISGDVVGVGFRSWVRNQAKTLQLTGLVKNLEDKTVEVVVEGNEQALQKLTDLCKRGPDVAWVEHVDIKWQKATGEFVLFEVLY